MKQLLFLLLTVMVGCSSHTINEYDNLPTIKINSGMRTDYKVYVIDSCEYIGKVFGGSADVLTHKGNCKYCIKRNKIN